MKSKLCASKKIITNQTQSNDALGATDLINNVYDFPKDGRLFLQQVKQVLNSIGVELTQKTIIERG